MSPLVQAPIAILRGLTNPPGGIVQQRGGPNLPITATSIGATAGIPVTIGPFNYYVTPWGNDKNDGSRGKPFKTLSRLTTALSAQSGGTTVNAYVAASDLIDDTLTPTLGTLGSPTVCNVYFQQGCRLISNNLSAALASAIEGQSNDANYTFNIYGNGLQIFGYEIASGNGIGSSIGAQVNAYDVNVAHCDDGISGHNSVGSTGISLYRCNVIGGQKSAFSHINATVFVAVDCSFTGLSGAISGIGQNINTGSIAATRCQFIPPLGTGVAAGTGTAFGPNNGTLTQCQIGTFTTFVAPTWGSVSVITVTDSFLNVSWDAQYANTFTRCFGKHSGRIRGSTGGSPVTYNNCVFVLGASGGATNGFIYGNNDSGATWQGIGYSCTNCIFTGYATVFGAGFSNNQATSFNGNSFANFTDLNGNTNNFNTTTTPPVAGSSTTGNITTSPGIGSHNTVFQGDYVLLNGSACIGAGSAGSNIGFT